MNNKLFILSTISVILILVGAWGLYSFRTESAYNFTLPSMLVKENNFEYGSMLSLSDSDYFERVEKQFIEEKLSFLEADLSEMRLRVYKEGVVVKEVPILTKGREGSWWETPAGIYKIEAKESNHFSSIGKVYQPWSMVFQGNFFIHGWPYYEDGTEVSSTYSGGCIRLSTEDAKEVYKLVDVKMPVLVYEKDFTSDEFRYKGRSPTLSAEKYMIADLGNSTILSEKGMQDVVPIASITKLMTALVATEYIHIEKNLVVQPSSIATTSKARLFGGQVITVYDLLFPLLMESSNESANVIADSMGRNYFVNLMNKKAKAINMKNSRFVDPSGSGDENVSSAEDLFALAKYILNNRRFIFNISAGKISRSVYGEPLYKDLGNYNIVPDMIAEFSGGKIGKTTAAGETYVGVYEESIQGEKRQIVVILLNSKDVYADTRSAIDYIREMYQ